jgi:serine/threonine protein phosphatase PrpC
VVIAMTYAKMTEKGSREINEDSAGSIEFGDNVCFVVADGLGGHGRGEVASKAVTAVFESEFLQNQTGVRDFLSRALATAQNAVLDLQKKEHAPLEMKTTAVALAVIDGKCAWAHIGDSRLYMFKKNKVKIRTLDHSVPQMLVLSGDIKEKKMRNHPDRNKLLRVIGIEWDSPKFEVSDEYDISECQAFLLCTDGFWELVDEKRMCALLKKSKSADEWLHSMTIEVKENGMGQEMDNYTAIAVIL